MNKEKLISIIKQGSKIWNNWRKSNKNIQVDLSGLTIFDIDFFEMDLNKVIFDDAIITNCNFSFSKINYASFKRSIIEKVDFSNASVTETDFSNTNISDTKFWFTNLTNCNFKKSTISDTIFDYVGLNDSDLSDSDISFSSFISPELSNCNFDSAKISYLVFADTDFREAKNLDKIKHERPSSIGIDTLISSKGDIPNIFLKESGIPEDIITKLKIIFTESQFYKCFISYSHQDELLAKKIYQDLTNSGIKCWFASEELKAGEKITTRIADGINKSDRLLLIISNNSLNSKWIRHEINLALEKEMETRGIVLFPIIIDNINIDNSSMRFIKDRLFSDFRNWKNKKKYNESLNKLIRDLTLSRVHDNSQISQIKA